MSELIRIGADSSRPIGYAYMILAVGLMILTCAVIYVVFLGGPDMGLTGFIGDCVDWLRERLFGTLGG